MTPIETCPRCQSLSWVIDTTTGGLREFACTMCGTYWWPIPEHIPFVDVEAPAPGTKRPGRPLKHGLSWRAHMTHCPHGHEYTPENTIHYRGYRKCRQCQMAANKGRTASRKASRARQRALREVAA